MPAETGTYFHLAYLRQKLFSRVISSYNWTDTRDMAADGLTKGTADRSGLAAIMGGRYQLRHPVHEYIEPTMAAAATTAAAAAAAAGAGAATEATGSHTPAPRTRTIHTE